MSWKSTAAILALSVFGVGSLVYLLFNKDEEDEYYYPKDYWDSSQSFQSYFRMQKSKMKVLKIKIPKECAGIVIGRNGSTIKDIEQKAGVKIKLRDAKTNDHKVCFIRGPAENVQYAQSLIHEVIISQPLIETYEMFVPVIACGRLIGKKGANINMICRNSNAKITIENCPTSPVSFERKVIIKGTSEQIALAKTLIEQKLEEELELQKKLETLVSNRPRRNQPKYLLPAKDKTEETEGTESYKHKEKFKVAAGNDGLLEVYVSAVESPDRIWLQMMGPLTVELDRLCDQMTEYYSNDENKKLHKLQEVRIGQIVAAPFIYDDKWYRAEVLELQSNLGIEEPNVVLYYVDYGNSSQCKKSFIYELRTDFLRLRFQAIECMLAKIKPRGSIWSEEATEVLEDLTHAAMWKSLIAKIYTYKPRPQKTSTREGSPVPCVELYDPHGEKTIDIAEELVERGYADWEEGVPEVKSSPT